MNLVSMKKNGRWIQLYDQDDDTNQDDDDPAVSTNMNELAKVM